MADGMFLMALPTGSFGGGTIAYGEGLEEDIEPRQTSDREEITTRIYSNADVVTARLRGREMAEAAGFQGTDLTIVSVIISEMARNVAETALPGEIAVSICKERGKIGIMVVARTCLAMKAPELFFADRLRLFMDESKIYYNPQETIVTMKKWVNVWAQ